MYDEIDRLWRPGKGEWVRLRTWDVFARVLPAASVVLDVGGGPGVHAAAVTRRGHRVVLVDPVERHVREAGARADGSFAVLGAEARSLPVADRSVDVVLLMGPLYHLVDRTHRFDALAEVRRVLRPGGLLVAEFITRNSWVLDATRLGLLHEPEELADLDRVQATGLTQDPDRTPDGAWWAYFHEVDEAIDEVATSGYVVDRAIGVEGFVWLLGDLEERIAAEADALLAVTRRIESEPSLLGASPHLLIVARSPDTDPPHAQIP